MPTRIAGIQPGYLPWLGYFDQMRRVDAFVIADEMQYSSSGWAHRNRIRGPQSAHWLTLPARPKRGQRICEVHLDSGVPWLSQHLTTLQHFYGRSPFAAEILAALARTLDRPTSHLVDVSIPVIRLLARCFGITTPLLVSSELGLEQRYGEYFPERPGPSHRIVAFLKSLGASELLLGASGRNYLDESLCTAHGIRVELHDYRHPTYDQLHVPFISHLSAIDLLLCAGEEHARRIFEAVP
jgi:hypothetical protein